MLIKIVIMIICRAKTLLKICIGILMKESERICEFLFCEINTSVYLFECLFIQICIAVHVYLHGCLSACVYFHVPICIRSKAMQTIIYIHWTCKQSYSYTGHVNNYIRTLPLQWPCKQSYLYTGHANNDLFRAGSFEMQ